MGLMNHANNEYSFVKFSIGLGPIIAKYSSAFVDMQNLLFINKY